MNKDEILKILSEASEKISSVYLDHTFSDIVFSEDSEKKAIGDSLYDDLADAKRNTERVINQIKGEPRDW